MNLKSLQNLHPCDENKGVDILLVFIISSTRHTAFIMTLWLCEQGTECKGRLHWSVELFTLFDGNKPHMFFFPPSQLISICISRNSALATGLWCRVDTTANESNLKRRTIWSNACTQEKIIEFLSVLYYNESLDISTDSALRTLQSMDN